MCWAQYLSSPLSSPSWGPPNLQAVIVSVLVLRGPVVPRGPEQLAPPVHLLGLVLILARKRGSWPSSAQAHVTPSAQPACSCSLTPRAEPTSPRLC